MAIRVLDIEVLRAPLGRSDRLDDRHAVVDALLVERLDAVNARRGVEMLVVALVLAGRVIFGCFLQVKFQSVQNTDRVEPFPWLPEREADLLVVRDRALKVVDKELWSERCHTWLQCAHTHPIRAEFCHKEAQKAQNQQHLFELFVLLCGKRVLQEAHRVGVRDAGAIRLGLWFHEVRVTLNHPLVVWLPL